VQGVEHVGFAVEGLGLGFIGARHHLARSVEGLGCSLSEGVRFCGF
jgi:hypothetical protein